LKTIEVFITAPVEIMLKELPPDLQREAEDFIIFLARRHEEQEVRECGQPSWNVFVDQMYGCMAQAPIQRQPQGESELRHHVA
jgi:hypothetical protein